MRKYAFYIFLFIAILGIFFVTINKHVNAQTSAPLGACQVGFAGTPFSDTQAHCMGQGGTSWAQYGYCVLSNGTVQSGWTNTTCINDNHGISWSTNPPAIGWCDVAGDQVYSGWTSASCNVHSPRGNWTATAPAVGWCTNSTPSNATSGWTQYECQIRPGVWYATNPNQTLSTGTGTGTGGTGGGTGSSTGSGTIVSGTQSIVVSGADVPPVNTTSLDLSNITIPDTTGSSTTSSNPTTNSSLSGGLVTCDNVTTKCDFTALLAMINGIIHFILFDMVVPIAAIMFAYAGFLMITAGGEAAHARTKAKNIFFNAFIGLIIAVACWLIVSTILHILGYDGSWIGLQV